MTNEFTGEQFMAFHYGRSQLYYESGYLRSFWLTDETLTMSIGSTIFRVGVTTTANFQQQYPLSRQNRIPDPDGGLNVWLTLGYFVNGELKATDETIWIGFDTSGNIRGIILNSLE